MGGESISECRKWSVIEEVEENKMQLGKRDRELFENHLMGYTMDHRYRLVAWLDYRDGMRSPCTWNL